MSNAGIDAEVLIQLERLVRDRLSPVECKIIETDLIPESVLERCATWVCLD
jgi:acyl-CoA dehydrogenase